MQIHKIFLTAALISSTITMAQAQQEKKAEEVCYNPNAKGDTSKRSIKSAAMGKIGGAAVIINYHSPGVRGRTIWGGLVPYNEVWVTGAHNATTIETDKTLIVGGSVIPKGKYALFTIPGKKEWIIIINKNWNQHLTDDYQQKEDIARIKIRPKMAQKKVERLQYFIEDGKAGKGLIAIAWEKIRVEFAVTVN
jgi:hypothetical protein